MGDDLKRTTDSRKRPNTYFNQRMMRRGVFETRFSDRVTGHVAKATEAELFGLLEGDEKILVWFVDTTAVTGFGDGIGPAGTGLVTRFKKQGGKVMIVVITDRSVFMMAKVISAASFMEMKIFDSRDKAMDHLVKEVLPDAKLFP